MPQLHLRLRPQAVTDVSGEFIPDPLGVALEWLQFASIVLLGIVSYFLKRSLGTQDKLQDEVQELKTKIAVILDRDRRRRLSDYLEEDAGRE
jgi:hypothetical protein